MVETLINQGLIQNLNQRNLCVNGGFEIWQRGVAFAGVGSQVYTADKWITYYTGTQTWGVYRSALSPRGSGFGYSLNMECTVRSNSICHVYQVIENSQIYKGQTMTVSAMVKSNIAGFKVYLQDGVGGGTESEPHTGDNTWQKLTGKIVMPDNSGAYLLISLGYHDYSSSLFNTYVDDVMVVVGDQPQVDFVPTPPAEDLLRCQRYYEIGTVDSELVVARPTGSNSQTQQTLLWKVTKASNPTKTQTSALTVQLHRIAELGQGTNNDSPNWFNTFSGSAEYFYWSSSRLTAQTTYGCGNWHFTWEAEVT